MRSGEIVLLLGVGDSDRAQATTGNIAWISIEQLFFTNTLALVAAKPSMPDSCSLLRSRALAWRTLVVGLKCGNLKNDFHHSPPLEMFHDGFHDTYVCVQL